MKKKSVLFCLLAVLAAGLAVFFLVRGSQGSGAFRGSFVKNSDSYLLDAERMTGTDTHTLALQKGDVLQIHFAVGEGSLKLTITAPDSTELYAGNGMVGFVAKERVDGKLILPEAVQILKMKAGSGSSGV